MEALPNIEKDERFDIAALRYNEAVQMYLNGLDRLCFCIKKGYLDKNDMKVEYREIIISAVKDHEEKFGKSTSYTNIIDIHDEWKRS
ncbi:hypothetical protein [Enterobacter ludwigii]